MSFRSASQLFSGGCFIVSVLCCFVAATRTAIRDPRLFRGQERVTQKQKVRVRQNNANNTGKAKRKKAGAAILLLLLLMAVAPSSTTASLDCSCRITRRCTVLLNPNNLVPGRCKGLCFSILFLFSHPFHLLPFINNCIGPPSVRLSPLACITSDLLQGACTRTDAAKPTYCIHTPFHRPTSQDKKRERRSRNKLRRAHD